MQKWFYFVTIGLFIIKALKMDIQTDRDITGQKIRDIRSAAGMSLKDFWGVFGICPAGGSRYETGEKRIPKHVRPLLFIRHVAGLSIDTSTVDGARYMQFLGDMVRKAAQIQTVPNKSRQ